PGITLEQFNKLGQPIDSPEAADVLAKYLVGDLLWRSLRAADATSQGISGTAPSIFISYSRQNGDWVSRLRTLLRPVERRGLLSSWVDADIEPGLSWENQLMSKLGSAQAALLLVSPALLGSEYVQKKEIPVLVERMKGDKNFRLFWTLIEACEWQTIPELQEIQAIGDVKIPISASPTKSDEQCRLIELVEKIATKLAV
ncbi:MAG TPA: toll/interleukin-1 receptor domain-containing protein, partial [Kofleriaceae bacterium]